MKPAGVRWWLLVEDPLHERLALKLAVRLRWNRQPVKAYRSPAGRGAASAWVIARYAKLLRETVRCRPGERVVLLVMVDGDNQGVAKRKQALNDALRSANEPIRDEAEPAIIFVPTWSVETWLLAPDPTLSESVSYKERLREPLQDHLEQAVSRLLLPGDAELPSLLDAANELNRAPA